MNKKGVTLTELLIVIVIMGIIASISTIIVTRLVTNTRIEVDSHNVNILNDATETYATLRTLELSEVFTNIDTNEERMQVLVNAGYLNNVIVPEQNNASFIWNSTNNTWTIEGGEYIGLQGVGETDINLTLETLESLESMGAIHANSHLGWQIDSNGISSISGAGSLLLPVSTNTYTLEVTMDVDFAANGMVQHGGPHIIFDAVSDNGEVRSANGYGFHMSYNWNGAAIRGYRNGYIVSGWPLSLFTAESTDAIHNRATNPDWWQETHTLKVHVTNVNEDTRIVYAYIDNILAGTYQYDDAHEGTQLYAGLYTWSNGIMFSNIKIY